MGFAGSGGDNGGSAASQDPSLLLSIPTAELHEVSGRQQKLLAQGPLSITLADRASRQQLALPAPAVPQARGAAAPTKPPGLYPEVYQPVPSSTAPGSSSSKDASTAIVISVGGVSWDVLPSSQTLKVGGLSFVFSLPSRNVYYTVTLAAGTDEEAVALLVSILSSATIYRESEALLADASAVAGDAALSGALYKSSLARGVHTSSRYLASGLKVAAGLASAGIGRGAAYLAERQAPAEKPVQVSETTKKRLEQTEKVTSVAAKAAHTAVNGLAWAGAKLADGVLRMAGANKPASQSNPGTLREVSHAAMSGFVEVWDAMEDAGRLVLLSSRDGVASVVGKKYGEEVAQASVQGMNTAGHSADAVMAARKLGVRTVAKSALKTTAKGIVQQWGRSSDVGTAAGSGTLAPSQ